MKNLTGPIIGLHFMKHNSVVIDTTHGLINFPHLTMQVKSASSQASAKPQPVLILDSITIPQMTTKTITEFVDHSSEWNTTGTVTPVEKFTEAASLIISHSMSTIFDRKIAVRVTNTTQSPYTINKNTQIAEFSVLTPEQSKFTKPVDTAILIMIPEGDPDLVTYLTELLRTNKLDQQIYVLVSDTRKSWQHRRSYSDPNTNPHRTPWIAAKGETKSKRQHWITNGILKNIWLDRHTAHGNWETSSWRRSGWVPRHIC